MVWPEPWTGQKQEHVLAVGLPAARQCLVLLHVVDAVMTSAPVLCAAGRLCTIDKESICVQVDMTALQTRRLAHFEDGWAAAALCSGIRI